MIEKDDIIIFIGIGIILLGVIILELSLGGK